MPGARVASLHLYPLKGGRRIDVADAVVTPRGLQSDRRWMVVDAGGAFLTQREVPRLALVTALPVAGGLGLRLGAPGRPWLEVPVREEPTATRVVRLWAGTCVAEDQGERAAAWLSDWLERPCRLVWQPDGARRRVDQRYATGGDDIVSFADGYPLLVCSEASLDDLNTHLAAPVPMTRFRPNVVVGGWPAWREDGVGRMWAGGVELALVKACARCAVTTIDQETAERGGEPLRTLGRVRRGPRGVLFGENAIPTRTGRIAVGDEVEVLEAREPARRVAEV